MFAALFGLLFLNKSVLRLTLAIGTLGVLFVAFLATFGDITASVDALTTAVNAMNGLLIVLVTNQYLRQLNVIFPLQEFLGFLSLWFIIAGLAMVIRFLRSWLPTVGG